MIFRTSGLIQGARWEEMKSSQKDVRRLYGEDVRLKRRPDDKGPKERQWSIELSKTIGEKDQGVAYKIPSVDRKEKEHNKTGKEAAIEENRNKYKIKQKQKQKSRREEEKTREATQEQKEVEEEGMKGKPFQRTHRRSPWQNLKRNQLFYGKSLGKPDEIIYEKVFKPWQPGIWRAEVHLLYSILYFAYTRVVTKKSKIPRHSIILRQGAMQSIWLDQAQITYFENILSFSTSLTSGFSEGPWCSFIYVLDMIFCCMC